MSFCNRHWVISILVTLYSSCFPELHFTWHHFVFLVYRAYPKDGLRSSVPIQGNPTVQHSIVCENAIGASR
jgi:hypothetical protein